MMIQAQVKKHNRKHTKSSCVLLGKHMIFEHSRFNNFQHKFGARIATHFFGIFLCFSFGAAVLCMEYQINSIPSPLTHSCISPLLEGDKTIGIITRVVFELNCEFTFFAS